MQEKQEWIKQFFELGDRLVGMVSQFFQNSSVHRLVVKTPQNTVLFEVPALFGVFAGLALLPYTVVLLVGSQILGYKVEILRRGLGYQEDSAESVLTAPFMEKIAKTSSEQPLILTIEADELDKLNEDDSIKILEQPSLTPIEQIKASGVSKVEEETVVETESTPLFVADDLTKIKGIGPAYAATLKAAGISTFVQLIETEIEFLAELFRQADQNRPPTLATWAEQASEILSNR